MQRGLRGERRPDAVVLPGSDRPAEPESQPGQLPVPLGPDSGAAQRQRPPGDGEMPAFKPLESSSFGMSENSIATVMTSFSRPTRKVLPPLSSLNRFPMVSFPIGISISAENMVRRQTVALLLLVVTVASALALHICYLKGYTPLLPGGRRRSKQWNCEWVGGLEGRW